MSRPRKPYGPNPPGRLAATMIKVLAAEMSDSGRLGRGKRYWNDNAVIDLVVGHLAVTAEVQGSRAVPYVVTLGTTEGKGVPSRRQVRIRCTCPDDDGFDAACKHAVAALFALSDEVAIDPAVIDRWRGTPARDQTDGLDDPLDSHPFDNDDGVDRTGWASVTRLQPRAPRPWEAAAERHDGIEWGDEVPDDDDADDNGDDVQWGSRLNRVVPLRRRPSDASRNDPADNSVDNCADDDVDPFSAAVPGGRNSPRSVTLDPSVAQIATMLQPPNGATPPTFPPAQPITHPRLADQLVDEVLTSALDEFDVNWL